MSVRDVVIVGGGITGLAAAYRLERKLPGRSITLVERRPVLGGKIITEHTGDGYVIEAGPDSFLSRKPHGIGLCRELGLDDRLYGRNPDHHKTFVRRGDRLYPLPEGLSGMVPTDLKALEENELISPAGRRRLAWEPELPPRPPNGDESVAAFATRRLGPEVFQNLVEPLMGGIYAGDASQLSLEATFPQLRTLELEHGSLLAGLRRSRGNATAASADYPPFVSLPGGMAELVEAVAARLEGVEIRTGVAVERLEAGDAYRLALSDGTELRARALIVTTPAYVTARLLTPVDDLLATAHAAIPHASTATVTLGFDAGQLPAPLDGYGYVIPRIEATDVLACTWTSSKWVGRAPAGKVALRVYLGRFGFRDVLADSDDALIDLSREEIARTLNITAPPELARVYRWPLGSPQYNLGHPARLAAIEARLKQYPGLYLAGASYRGVGIPDCIRSGEAAAEAATAYLNL